LKWLKNKRPVIHHGMRWREDGAEPVKPPCGPGAVGAQPL
jgi:hypothetical protein